jgi:hypothetical protein
MGDQGRSEIPGASASDASDDDALAMEWQYVERSEDGNFECLHTIANLTDVHAPQEDSHRAGTDKTSSVCSSNESAEKPPIISSEVHAEIEDVRDGSESFVTVIEHEMQDDAVLRDMSLPMQTVVYSIHTPPPTPRVMDSPSFEGPPPLVCVDDPIINSPFGGLGKEGAQYSIDEKVDIVIAAFDGNGDGHLDYKDVNALRAATRRHPIGLEDFRKVCASTNSDPKVGLGADAILCVYFDSATGPQYLDADFQVARQKLLDPKSVPQACSMEASLFAILPCVAHMAAQLPAQLASKLAARRVQQRDWGLHRTL